MWQIQRQGNDIIVKNVDITCWGGGNDAGDGGQTESGILNDGSDPNLLGCALPIRSTENATRMSPLADAQTAHIPWGTTVHFWKGSDEYDPANSIDTVLIDNGPDFEKYPNHAGDLTVAAAQFFSPQISIYQIANKFSAILNYRIINAAMYCNIATST
jgi:hypothetical protein